MFGHGAHFMKEMKARIGSIVKHCSLQSVSIVLTFHYLNSFQIGLMQAFIFSTKGLHG